MSSRRNRPTLTPKNAAYTWEDLVVLTGLDQLGEVRRDARDRPYVILRDETRDVYDTDAEGFDQIEERVVTRSRTVVRARINPNGTITAIQEHASKETGWTKQDADGVRRRWWRWRSSPEWSVTARPDGTWLKVRPLRGSFISEVITDEFYWAPLEAVLEALPEPAPATLAYPVLGHYYEPQQAPQRDWHQRQGANDPGWTTRVRQAASKSRDAREFAAALFGKTRVRKDLVKALAGADLSRICVAEAFRGLVPVDWIVDFLRRGPLGGNERDEKRKNFYPDVRGVLRRLDEPSLRALLRAGDPRHQPMRDIVQMHSRDYDRSAPLPRCRSWEELHAALVTRTNLYAHLVRQRDAVVARGRKIVIDDKPVKHTDEALSYETQIVTDTATITLYLATHEDDLYEWGQVMDHCIATYGHQLRSRRTLLGAVTMDGKLCGNFEITGFNAAYDATVRAERPSMPVLRQLLGRSNSTLPDEVRVPVVDHFAALGAEVGHFWGQDAAELDRQLGRVA